MKLLYFIITAASTLALITVLNTQQSLGGGNKTPRLGYFLSPQKGFWQNAEAVDEDFSADIKSDELQGKTNVYFDDRLVPHVYADNEHDAFFIEGYLHAKFRLWQMDFQTYAAAGRLSEIMGDSVNGSSFIGVDKFFRRLGMVYGAEHAVATIEADPETKAVCDAYTAGVNAYIKTLDESSMPLEYKLLDYKPEPWTNLKSALFLKYMAWDLAGGEEDFAHTNAKSVFTKQQYDLLYPYRGDSAVPIISLDSGRTFPKADKAVPPQDADSLYFHFKQTAVMGDKEPKPERGVGSNNWAVAGAKTKSGKPILCNDPHLGLNLPSLWYELQLSTPNFNAYGVSFPGAATVIIGFNDSCSFGFTNSGRDVRDYYELKFKDSTMQEYWFDSAWKQTTFRDEVIKIKGKPDDTEHIAMTVFGPVMYDHSYPDKLQSGKAYACRWLAHDSSNEIRTFYKLDKSKNYSDYLDAISTYKCPAQNMIFATVAGDIAIKQQGRFPLKWKGQGDFVMPGFDSSYMWHGYIPDSANIVMHNPQRGFVSSANQMPYDTSYPYYQSTYGGGAFYVYRGYIINRNLSKMQNITTDDMQQLQTNNYNVFAEMAKPLLLKYINENSLDEDGKKYLGLFKNWNLVNDAKEQGPVVFTMWWDSLMTTTYADEFAQSKLPLAWPDESSLLDGMKHDSAFLFADDINTPSKENDSDCINKAFAKAVATLKEIDKGNLEWTTYKSSAIRHLLRIPALSRMDLYSGGGENIINAHKKFTGPSWRMVVEMTAGINAYGVYPGGQSGNPGSKYYDDFIDNWLAGKYYKLLFVSQDVIAQEKNLKGKITFSKS